RLLGDGEGVEELFVARGRGIVARDDRRERGREPRDEGREELAGAIETGEEEELHGCVHLPRKHRDGATGARPTLRLDAGPGGGAMTYGFPAAALGHAPQVGPPAAGKPCFSVVRKL